MDRLPQQASHFQELLEQLPNGALLFWPSSGQVITNAGFDKLLPRVLDSGNTYSPQQLAAHLSKAFPRYDAFEDHLITCLQLQQDITGWVAPGSGDQLLSMDFRFFSLGTEGVVIGTIKDVASIKKAIDRITVEQEKYRLVLENMNLGVLEVDNDSIIKDAFDKFCEMTGYNKAELIGKNAQELLLVDEDRPILEEEHQKRLQGKSSSYEVRIKRKDGTLIWVMISGTPMYNSKGKVCGSFGIHLDITRLKATEEALKAETRKVSETMKWKESIMAKMSHEMRTPINGIMGMINLLLEEGTLPSRQHHNLQTIKKSANNLLFLIEDLLDYAVLEQDEMKLEQKPFSLFEVLDSTKYHFTEAATAKALQIVFEYDETIPSSLLGDPSKIGQVLKHLLSNAVKFSEQSTIRIEARQLSNHEEEVELLLTVTDYGIGIPPNELKNILRGFYQIEQTQSVNTGIGIGLSMVKLITDRMNGELDIASEEGQGTTVSLYLTFKKNLKPARMTEGTAKLPAEVRILVAEDNIINQMLLKENIERWNFKCDVVDNGQKALQMIKEKDYDLVLMDVQMPLLDGIEATQYIRNKLGARKKNVPIIALTAYGFAEDRKKCLKAGMNDYIPKPFNANQLFYKIAELVNLKKHKSGGNSEEPSQLDFTQINKEVMNPEQIQHYTRNNSQMQQRVINRMLNDLPKEIPKIKSLADEHQWGLLFEIIHRLKPTISILGLQKAEPIIAQLNEELRSHEAPGNPAMINDLVVALEEALGELKQVRFK